MFQFRVWREEGWGGGCKFIMNDRPQFRSVFDVSEAFDVSNGVTFEFYVSFFPTVTVPPVWLTRC